MTRRKKKRWEDHQLGHIGRREARTAFYKDSANRISLNGGMEVFIYGSSRIISGRLYE